MAYIYAFQLGNDDLFKIGKTSNSLERRRNQLQTGCLATLTLFRSVSTATGADALAGEQFIKQRYAARLVRPRSEIFRFTPAEVVGVLAAAQEYVERELPREEADKAAVAQLEEATPDEEVLAATAELTTLHHQIHDMVAEKARLENQVKDAENEISRLTSALKIAIGKSSGIDGVAMWRIGKSRAKFNVERLAQEAPEVHAQYLALQFDGPKFKADQPKEYEKYMDTTPVRVFELLDES
ncbi:GIY-YIG nuclease family protein [Nocardia xishanensis]|uniref:GIY-YIG nuclease family protein n=1 Tax=Nocardia xishanensis TaxID=238964 RepID=UPI000835347A|nr:GIY-YIG nuclease family protein [Nocardia xishanensis]